VINILNIDGILNRLSLTSDMVVADFGCGAGFLTIPVAKKVKQGLVFAIDIQSPPLSVLKSNCMFLKLNNVQIIRSDLEKPRGSKLQDSSVDLALLINTLFQIDKKDAIIQEAKRVLKTQGKFVVVDSFLGKKKDNNFSFRVFKKIVESAGFIPEKQFRINDYYGVVFEKL